MRYSTGSAYATTCFCVLLMALSSTVVVVDTRIARAQSLEDEDAQGSKSVVQSAIRSFASAHGQADSKPALEAFYAARNNRPAWMGTQEAFQRGLKIRAMLKHADAHGLEPAAYDVAAPPSSDSASPADAALYDVALTDALLRYARDVQFGRVRPGAVYRDIDLPKRKGEGPTGLARALEEGTIDTFIAGLAPAHEGYRRLARALAHYRDVAAAGGWPSVFSTNENDPLNRKLLIKRLAAEDALLARTSDPSTVNLQAAIMRYQSRNGLKPDGQLGPATVASLKVPVATRIQQIAANMERWRWMPDEFESRHIVINIPGQTLEFVRDDAVVMTSRVMVGKKSTRSPILRAEARSLVVNPPWNVPTDIAARQILPKLKTDPNYLAAHNMVVVNGQFKQLPGPNNAMGTLMLDAPNRFDVYLHDTPGKAAFQNDDRELSNGCIRVQDMATLASFALSNDRAGHGERLNGIIASRKTTRLSLEDPLPIYMVYWTAIANADGNVEFRPDRYDRDPPLIKALANRSARHG